MYRPSPNTETLVRRFINGESETGSPLVKIKNDNLIVMGTSVASRFDDGTYIINETPYSSVMRFGELLHASPSTNMYLRYAVTIAQIVGEPKIRKRLNNVPKHQKILY